MVAGHFILQHTHVDGYAEVSLRSSIKIGAIGGCLMALPMMLFEWLVMQIQPIHIEDLDSEHDAPTSAEGSSGTRDEKVHRNRGLKNINTGLIVLQLIIGICGIVGLGAGSGAIGAAIMKASGHQALSVILATRAGAVGAAILGPGAIVLVLLLVGCCGGMIGALLLSRRELTTRSQT